MNVWISGAAYGPLKCKTVPGTVLHFNPEPPFAERRSVTSRARASVRHVWTVTHNPDSPPG